MKQPEVVENKHRTEEVKRAPKKHGISAWLITFIIVVLTGAIIGIVWIAKAVDINKDFDRPWWNWAILVAVVLGIIYFLNKKTPQVTTTDKTSSVKTSYRTDDRFWTYIMSAGIIVIILIALFTGTKLLNELKIMLFGSPATVSTTTIIAQKNGNIGRDLRWGINYFEPGKQYYYDESVSFLSRAVSPSFWGDTLHYHKEGDSTVYWDVVFDKRTGERRRCNDHDDKSTGDFYITVNKPVAVEIRPVEVTR